MIKINIDLTNQLLSSKVDKDFLETVLSSHKYSRIPVQKYLDIHDKELMLSLYNKCLLPFYKIGMLCGVSDATAKKYLVSYGIENPGHKRGVNSANRYFQDIDTKDKAYFLGFWSADGSIVHYRTSYACSWCLTQSDRYIIERFQTYSGIQCPIYITHKEDPRPRVQINISSKQMFEDLESHGVIQDKNHYQILPVGVPDNLIPHFIRGYFDGDGIAFSNLELGFCGCESLMAWIRDQLKPFVGNKNIYYNQGNHIYYLQYSKRDSVKKILSYLYEDKDDLYLERKYKNYGPLL